MATVTDTVMDTAKNKMISPAFAIPAINVLVGR